MQERRRNSFRGLPKCFRLLLVMMAWIGDVNASPYETVIIDTDNTPYLNFESAHHDHGDAVQIIAVLNVPPHGEEKSWSIIVPLHSGKRGRRHLPFL
jgi:hypothetical protein